jgi:hypothetical protein
MPLLRTLSLLFIILLFHTALSAQTILGIVANEQKQPLPFATISLLRLDSSLVKTGLSDIKGKYYFSKINKGDYVLKIYYTGYQQEKTNIHLVSDSIALDTIHLKIAGKTLKTVTITAQKPLITYDIDKLVVNVDGTILSKGNNILDVLKKSPGVTTDASNNIILNGKSGVTVFMDGRATNLSPSDLSTLLSGMSSESVQSIEIMANPSSKYEASGSSGIINIITKKKKANGYSLSTTLTGYQASHTRENLSLNYLQKIDKFGIYSNFSFSHSPSKFDFTSNRLIPSDSLIYALKANLSPDYLNYFYRGGVDYQLSKKITIGGLITANISNGHTNYDGTTTIDSLTNGHFQNLETHTFNYAKSQAWGFNLYFDNKIDTLGQQLTINLDNSIFNSSSKGDINNITDIADISQFIRNSSGNQINIYSVKLDYVYPFNKKIKLETGFKSSLVNTENHIKFENLVDGDYINDPGKTNDFHFKENINAIYGSVSDNFSFMTAKFGIRAEQTNNQGQSSQANSAINRHYLDLFPTLYLDKKINSSNEINFSYGRRVDRPSYKDLNPFIYYNNPYSYYQGNPYLNPQYSQSLNLRYVYHSKYALSFNYMVYNNIIVSTPTVDSVTHIEYTRPVNLDKQQLFYVNLSIPVSVTKWWSIYNYINLYYSKYQSSYLSSSFAYSKPTAYVYQDHTFNLNKTTTFDLLLTYDAPQYSGIYLIEHRFQANFTVQKTFMQNAATVKITMNDIFKGSTTTSTYNYENLIGKNTGYYDQRYLQLTLSYSLNRLKASVNSNRSRGNEDEQRRIK